MKRTALVLIIIAILNMVIFAVKAGKCLSDYAENSGNVQQILLDANI